MRQTVVTKYALEEPGANLSGLPNCTSLNEKTLYNMIVEELSLKREKDEVDEKKKKRNKHMLTHEDNILKASFGSQDESDNSPQSDISGSVDNSSKRSRKVREAEENIDERMMREYSEDSRMYRDIQERKLALEERKVALEERKLEIQAGNSEISEQLREIMSFIKNKNN
jgi:hypothetical protein